jgi:hypothetical protein
MAARRKGSSMTATWQRLVCVVIALCLVAAAAPRSAASSETAPYAEDPAIAAADSLGAWVCWNPVLRDPCQNALKSVHPVTGADLWPALLVSFVIIAACLAGAWIKLRKQEL